MSKLIEAVVQFFQGKERLNMVRFLCFLLLCFCLNAQCLAQSAVQKTETAETKELTLLERLHAERAAQKVNQGSAQPAWQGSAEQPSALNLILKMLQALGLCLGLLFLGVWAFRKYAPKVAQVGGRRLCVKERLALTSKTSLLLVELDGRSVIVAVGNERVSFSDNDMPFRLADDEESDFGVLCQDGVRAQAS